MTTELKLPLLGDVMTEGTVAQWLKPDGARVDKGEPVYQLETDKVTYAVEAPAAGVLRHAVTAGTVVAVGAIVAHLDTADDDADDEVRASPAARRLARAHHVPLDALPAARLLREQDVQRFLLRQAPGDTPSDRPALAEPLSGRRKTIAERMTASLREMAQLTVSLEVDMSAAAALREQLTLVWGDDAPSITDLVSRAAVLALGAHPRFNATLDDLVLTQHQAIHLGLAVDTDEGLIVPVVRAAHELSLRGLAVATRTLASRARANQLQLSELQGGTFTVTTLGQLGVDFFTPIVNPPQVAILGVGRVFSKLALVGGTVHERAAMYLNLSFDHRAVDGAPAARFLNEVKRLLELPAALLV